MQQPTKNRQAHRYAHIELSPIQSQAYDKILDWFHSADPYDNKFTLMGFAGTGKSLLTAMITEYVLSNTNLTVGLASPTHKAVEVTRNFISHGGSIDSNLVIGTIHSLMGLTQRITSTGKQIFVSSKTPEHKIKNVDLLILDESSMLSSQLFLGKPSKYGGIVGLLELQAKFNFKILFVGDPAQIPPVGETQAMPMDEAAQQDMGIKSFTLTEIHRQAADSPIIRASMSIRNSLFRPTQFPRFEEDASFEDVLDSETSGISFLTPRTRQNHADFLNSCLKSWFTDTRFEDSADFAKVIAYRNATVFALNKKIRGYRYPNSTNKIEIGEKLVTFAPFVRTDPTTNVSHTLLQNNEGITVKGFEVISRNFDGADLKIYWTKVESDKGESLMLPIIHEDSQEDLDLILEHFVSLAKEKNIPAFEAADRWRSFYKFKEYFAAVGYNYAITAHKSQGSTYVNTAIMVEDIMINRKVEERNRILYTAVTRPSHKLLLIK